MPSESYADQLARELNRLGVTSRLKGAPNFHFWEIGQTGRDRHFGLNAALKPFTRKRSEGENLTAAEQVTFKQLQDEYGDPAINPYTYSLMTEDEQATGSIDLKIKYFYEGSNFKLLDPVQTTRLFVEHFYPIQWPEFNDMSDWQLMQLVIPAMMVAKVGLEIYENQRWLYDESSQRAAEVLSNRYQERTLPLTMLTTEKQRNSFTESIAEAEAEKKTKPTSWMQAAWERLTRKH